MDAIFNNIIGILGFGFVGLSFLFVYLAYSNVRQIVAQKSPNEQAVKLSRFFMITALVFMICAGPLQWVTVYLDHQLTQRGIELHVTLTHPDWDESFGEVLLVKRGEQHKLINNPYKGKFKADEEIQLNASIVAEKIRSMRSQITVLNTEITDLAEAVPPPPTTSLNGQDDEHSTTAEPTQTNGTVIANPPPRISLDAQEDEDFTNVDSNARTALEGG